MSTALCVGKKEKTVTNGQKCKWLKFSLTFFSCYYICPPIGVLVVRFHHFNGLDRIEAAFPF
jgi:hypothetical protein